MSRLDIVFLISLGVLHRFNCLQRSDWTYDPETDLVNFTTNGTTHSCSPKGLSGGFIGGVMFPLIAPSFFSTDGEESQHNQSRRSDEEVLRSILQPVPKYRQSSCNVPTPSTEETLDRIVKFYRSWSLDDNPATPQWYDQVLRNLTQMEDDCRGDATRPTASWMESQTAEVLHQVLYNLSRMDDDRRRDVVRSWTRWLNRTLQPQNVEVLRERASKALDLGRDLPQLRDNASAAQTAFEEARRHHGVDVGSLFATFRDEHVDRERLFANELDALARDDIMMQGKCWYDVARYRTDFVEDLYGNFRLEHPATAEAVKVTRTRMNMLYQMALANEFFSQVDFIVSFVTMNMKYVCASPDEYDMMRLMFSHAP